MPIPTPLLTHATRTVAILRPRQSDNNNNSLNTASEIASILGGVFGGLAVLVAVVFGIWTIRRANKEDRNKWYKILGRILIFWRRA